MATSIYMTQTQYANHRNISQPRIAKLISEGKLDGAYTKKGRRYYIDPVQADRILDGNRNPKHDKRLNYKPRIEQGNRKKDSKPLTATSGQTLNEAARLQMWYRAALMKLKYEQESGALISREKVNRQAAHLGTMIRTHLESLPSRLAPEVAGLRSTKKIAELIQREVRTILTALSHEIKRL